MEDLFDDDFDEEPNPLQVEAEEIQAQMQKRIENCVAVLMEFCDTVQICCTKVLPKGGGTVSKHRGGGNVYARLASVNEWYRENR